jgi:hypothetical protein
MRSRRQRTGSHPAIQSDRQAGRISGSPGHPAKIGCLFFVRDKPFDNFTIRDIPRHTLLIATGLILGGSLERNNQMSVELRLVFLFWVAPMVHP